MIHWDGNEQDLGLTPYDHIIIEKSPFPLETINRVGVSEDWIKNMRELLGWNQKFRRVDDDSGELSPN